MFAYQRDGKLCLMMKGSMPAPEGVTPDVVIEPVVDGEDVTARILVNGEEVAIVEEAE